MNTRELLHNSPCRQIVTIRAQRVKISFIYNIIINSLFLTNIKILYIIDNYMLIYTINLIYTYPTPLRKVIHISKVKLCSRAKIKNLKFWIKCRLLFYIKTNNLNTYGSFMYSKVQSFDLYHPSHLYNLW